MYVHSCHHCGHDSLICVTWLTHTCDITHSYVWHNSRICVTWRIYTCTDAIIAKMSQLYIRHLCVRHDSFTRIYIYSCHTHVIRMNESCHTTFMRMTWFIKSCHWWHDCQSCHTLGSLMCMTHSYMWHDYAYDMTHESCHMYEWVIHMSESSVWHDSFMSHVMYDMTHSCVWQAYDKLCVWHDSFIHIYIHTCHTHVIRMNESCHTTFMRMTWLINVVWHDSFMRMTCVWHDSFIRIHTHLYAFIRIYTHLYAFIRIYTHLHVWYDSCATVIMAVARRWCRLVAFIRVTWLTHTCDMTHSYVWHDPSTCVT